MFGFAVLAAAVWLFFLPDQIDGLGLEPFAWLRVMLEAWNP